MKEDLRDFYIKKGQTMTREEMMKYVFGNSITDKLNDREKELMTLDEQKIFNTAYEEGYDDGYEDGFEDGATKIYDKECNIYHEGVIHALDCLIKYLKYYEDMSIPYDTVKVFCERVYNDIAHSYGEI